MQKKDGTENKAMSSAEANELRARTEAAEANERSLAAALIKSAGPEALTDAALPRPGKLVRVQFLRNYTFGGLIAARRGSYISAPFSARLGDIFDLPEALYERLHKKYETANPLFEADAKKWQPQSIHRVTGVNAKTGQVEADVVTYEVDDLIKKAVPVGLPRAPQAD